MIPSAVSCICQKDTLPDIKIILQDPYDGRWKKSKISSRIKYGKWILLKAATTENGLLASLEIRRKNKKQKNTQKKHNKAALVAKKWKFKLQTVI